jgi:hypothetical protein
VMQGPGALAKPLWCISFSTTLRADKGVRRKGAQRQAARYFLMSSPKLGTPTGRFPM